MFAGDSRLQHLGTTAPPNNYRFAGEQWDEDPGLYYNRACYLNPNTGRFWTMDKFQGNSHDPLSLHKYLYVHNNPVGLLDPSGRRRNWDAHGSQYR